MSEVEKKNIVYCFVNSEYTSGDVIVAALSNDGCFLSSHFSSNEYFGKHDIGHTSDWHHEIYSEHFPDGFETEWIERDELDSHVGFVKAKELYADKNREGSEHE